MSYFDGLPKKLRIGPFDVKVTIRDFDEVDTFGDWHFGGMELRFNRIQPTAIFAADTVIHEIVHAIYKIYSLERQDSEERIASVMGGAWAQVFRDNPKLFSWLREALHG